MLLTQCLPRFQHCHCASQDGECAVQNGARFGRRFLCLFAVGTNATKPVFSCPPEYKRNGENVMKTLVSMVALALALAFTGPAFAGDVTKATNAADCEKAGGMWDASTTKCSEKKSKAY